MGGLRHLAALALATGCHFDTPNPVQQDGASGDGFTDGSPLCFGNSLERVCLARVPTGVFEVGAPLAINTDASNTMCEPLTSATVDACVIAGTTVEIDDHLTAVGSRPLVLLSLTHIVIAPTAYLDVSSSHLGMPIGAGSNGAMCLSLSPPTGGAGGAGGSFTGRGGNGGAGPQSNGGISAPASTVTMLRGGCSGGAGSGPLGASAGAGGGAVDLIASGAIIISGIVNASGAGGSGGAIGAGGGGAGSGGMIALVGQQVQITQGAQLFANGGGGGGAGSDTATGNSGGDPTMATVAAQGGISAGQTGVGGDGSIGQSLGGSDGTAGNPGGGGGGGAAGVIAVDAPSLALSGTVSPGLTKN